MRTKPRHTHSAWLTHGVWLCFVHAARLAFKVPALAAASSEELQEHMNTLSQVRQHRGGKAQSWGMLILFGWTASCHGSVYLCQLVLQDITRCVHPGLQ
jgi:hypothetical protein